MSIVRAVMIFYHIHATFAQHNQCPKKKARKSERKVCIQNPIQYNPHLESERLNSKQASKREEKAGMQEATKEDEYVFVCRESSGASPKSALTSSTGFLVTTPTSISSTEHGSSPRFLEESDNDTLEKDEEFDEDEHDTIRNAVAHDDSEEDSDVSIELDDMPMVLPFLPALDASTQITKFEGFSEAISDAQQILDSRLLAYSQYQQMVRVRVFPY